MGRVVLKVGRLKLGGSPLLNIISRPSVAPATTRSSGGDRSPSSQPQSGSSPSPTTATAATTSTVVVNHQQPPAAAATTAAAAVAPEPAPAKHEPGPSAAVKVDKQQSLDVAAEQPVKTEQKSPPKATAVAENAMGAVVGPTELHGIRIVDMHEPNSDTMLVMLMKDPSKQLGMGIGNRQRGVLVTSLQPNSQALEKLQVKLVNMCCSKPTRLQSHFITVRTTVSKYEHVPGLN